MYFLLESSKYDEVNTTDTYTMEYYYIKYLSETFTLQKDTTIDNKLSKYWYLPIWATHLCITHVLQVN